MELDLNKELSTSDLILAANILYADARRAERAGYEAPTAKEELPFLEEACKRRRLADKLSRAVHLRDAAKLPQIGGVL